MAELLEQRIRAIDGATILLPRQANSLFVELPQHAIAELRRRGWRFYTFIGSGGCRFMCSWDTRPQDVGRFAQDIAEAIGRDERR